MDYSTPSSPEPTRGPLTAEVFLDTHVPTDDEQFLLDVLTGYSVEARVRIIPARRDPATLTWIVLVALPLQGFLSTLGNKVAEDAHGQLAKLVRRIGRSQQPASELSAKEPRPLVLQDNATGLQIILEPDLPDDAYQRLLRLDLSGIRYGPVHYDRTQKRWRSELNEAHFPNEEEPGHR